MFGGNLDPPKHTKRCKPNPMTYDIQLPTISPGVYGHYGRAPNTDYHVRWLQHRQRVQDADTQFLAAEAKRLLKEATAAKYDKHAEKKVFQRLIQERFQEKVKAYNQGIERRREKLKELLCKEEQEFIFETIDQAQKGVDTKMKDMKEKAELLKAQREAERLQIVNQKRMLQYIEECKELRPVLIKRNLVDSKNTQLQQIKENEIKKEAEKEIDNMWYNLMLKELDAKRERETQDMLKKNQTMQETVDVWNKQIQGKEMLMRVAKEIDAEDRLEMIKLQEQINREQIEALDAKRRKRDLIAIELKEQILVQEKFLAQRKTEEKAIDNAFTKLAQDELDRESSKIQDTTRKARREAAIYRQHLAQLDEERKQEERELNALLEEHRRMIEKKQEDAYCKLKKAKDELRKNVLSGRAHQLEYKKQEAENQLKLKEADNELLRMACEQNERLQAEHERLQAEEIREYREELRKQIETNNEKRRQEKEKLERELAEGLVEEEKRRRHVLEIINARLDDASYKHPFRKVLEMPPCFCKD